MVPSSDAPEREAPEASQRRTHLRAETLFGRPSAHPATTHAATEATAHPTAHTTAHAATARRDHVPCARLLVGRQDRDRVTLIGLRLIANASEVRSHPVSELPSRNGVGRAGLRTKALSRRVHCRPHGATTRLRSARDRGEPHDLCVRQIELAGMCKHELGAGSRSTVWRRPHRPWRGPTGVLRGQRGRGGKAQEKCRANTGGHEGSPR